MNIKELVTPEQYNQLKKEYNALIKNNEISFFDYCIKTYKITKTIK
tara:strand:+ start:14215 stop:14352 length:138 start_codon:yes stop_codon:yes gene_type:complete